jgi:hypothetical protein
VVTEGVGLGWGEDTRLNAEFLDDVFARLVISKAESVSIDVSLCFLQSLCQRDIGVAPDLQITSELFARQLLVGLHLLPNTFQIMLLENHKRGVAVLGTKARPAAGPSGVNKERTVDRLRVGECV